MATTDIVVRTPKTGNVFAGTWPDCPDCHGAGQRSKAEPLSPCSTCQTRSAELIRSLNDLITFDYYGRPKKSVSLFRQPGEEPVSSWIDITWAEIYSGNGVYAGTWPDCSECKGKGDERYESSFDGHRSDYDWRPCSTCQVRTHRFHVEHPNAKDLLLRAYASAVKDLEARYKTDLQELKTRLEADLEALPF